MINSILVWNVKGIANKNKMLYLKHLVKVYNLSLIALLEPMTTFTKAATIGRNLGLSQVYLNEDYGSKICICENKDLIILIYEQHITFFVDQHAKNTIFSIIYAKCNHLLQISLWTSLCTMRPYNSP